MTTISKKRTTAKNRTENKINSATQAAKKTKEHEPLSESGIPQQMSITEIDTCPRNYRLIFPKNEIEDFAEELKRHGIISSLTVRPMPDGRHELVVGERRYRAAQIAGIDILPVIVRELSDEQAKEIRLAENIHRENVHPLHEAFAVKDMLQTHSKIEEVAKRMGKSKGWAYSRIKLSELIEPLQEMFLNDKLTTKQAEAIASLAPSGQSEFYMDNCQNWEEEDFEVGSVDWLVNRLKCNLHEAPFNLKDKKLFPDAGPCSTCPFNSATLNYLFPEMAEKAVCSNSDCYTKKCSLHIAAELTKAFEQYKPDAIVCFGYLDKEVSAFINIYSGLSVLPIYSANQIHTVNAPVAPARESYEEAEEVTVFDESSYNQDMQEYMQELEAYHTKVMSGAISRGLFIKNNNYYLQLFELRGEENNSHHKDKVTAKEVQQAIKEGTATPELLMQEIARLEERETRSKEIDLDKIQEQVHDKFREQVYSFPEIRQQMTEADNVALRLIVFNALGWKSKSLVEDMLMPDLDLGARCDKGNIYNALSMLTDEQFCFMIRVVLSNESESKFPGNAFGYALYRCAESSGIDVEAICSQQKAKADERFEKKNEKVAALNRKIEKLKASAKAA